MAAEVTMILIDNSYYVPKDSDVFKTQLEAIRLYCRAKIKSNPNNRVGAATMGYGASKWPNPPTSDVEHFLTHTLEHIPWGGDLSVPTALSVSQIHLADFPKDTRRRMLVFVAGPGYLMNVILEIGKCLKEKNIALDVVSFADEDQDFDAYKKKNLKSFVDAANKGNNSHFAHVPRRSSPRTFLVSSKILSPEEAAALTEEGIDKKMNKKKKLKRNRTNKKKNHSQDLEEEAVSSSSLEVIFPHNLPVPPGQFVFGSL